MELIHRKLQPKDSVLERTSTSNSRFAVSNYRQNLRLEKRRRDAIKKERLEKELEERRQKQLEDKAYAERASQQGELVAHIEMGREAVERRDLKIQKIKLLRTSSAHALDESIRNAKSTLDVSVTTAQTLQDQRKELEKIANQISDLEQKIQDSKTTLKRVRHGWYYFFCSCMKPQPKDVTVKPVYSEGNEPKAKSAEF